MQLTAQNELKQTRPDEERSFEQLAQELAKSHIQLEEKSSTKRVLLSKHLPVWKQVLADAYQYFRATSARDLAFSRAGEWMLDNFYIVEQTFHQIEEDLPKSYFDQLPKLNTTSLKDYPRVFALAWELTRYKEGQLDLTLLTKFVQEYQHVTPLMIGELWALPTMLRISILENLANSVAKVTGKNPADILQVQPILPEPAAIINEAIVANCFISMRLLSTADWKSFFEDTSQVEQILLKDPAGIFADMDFETRDKYRSVVEEIARHSSCNEEDVAQFAIDFAQRTQTPATAKDFMRKSHVGFYLIDEGRAILEKEVNYLPDRKRPV